MEEIQKNVMVEKGLELNSKYDQNVERQRGRKTDVRYSRNAGMELVLLVDDE